MQIVILPLFVLTMFISVVFLKLSVGLPVRTLLLAVVFVMMVTFYKRYVAHFFNRHGILIFLFAFMAVLGSSLAIAQHETGDAVFLQLLRQILQPLMVLICAYVMCYIVGARATAMVLMGVAAVAGGVAVAQALGVDLAWKIREVIGSIQGDPALTSAFVKNKARAMGLAFSPIELSYLVAAVYVLLVILQRAGLVTDRMYWVIFGLILVVAIAIETRSLLLGLMVSEAIRIVVRGRTTTYLLIICAGVIGYAVFMMMPEIDSRLVSVDDQSASGRKVLYSFGLRLFLDNVMGFGWGFSAHNFAWLYWEHLTEFGKPEVVFRLDLHNAFLGFVLVYGITGIVPIVYFAIAHPRSALQFFLIFSCYFVHSFFHNKGFFLAGLYVWYVVAIYLYLLDHGFMKPLSGSASVNNKRPGAFTRVPVLQPAGQTTS